MYVCVCMAVTERQIREAAQGGTTTLNQLRRDLGVSSECGQCAASARKCLTEEAHAIQRSATEQGTGSASAPHFHRGDLAPTH